MMDCDTTGIEPDLALIKYKKLVGGGMIKIVNNTVPTALFKLGYTHEQTGTFPLLIPFTLARCMRITSRNGSRLMYHPGQAPPGMTFADSASLRFGGVEEASAPTRAMPAPRFVSARLFFVASVAGTSGSHCSAILLDCRYASPHMIAVTHAA